MIAVVPLAVGAARKPWMMDVNVVDAGNRARRGSR
jgi:hypothetical protein